MVSKIFLNVSIYVFYQTFSSIFKYIVSQFVVINNFESISEERRGTMVLLMKYIEG